MRSGIELVLDLVGFDAQVRGAALVVTGEGSLDAQSLAGKAPVGVLHRARAAGVPVVAVVGRSLLPPEEAVAAGFAAVQPLSQLEPDAAAEHRARRATAERGRGALRGRMAAMTAQPSSWIAATR